MECRVYSVGLRVYGVRCRFECKGCRVEGVGCGVNGVATHGKTTEVCFPKNSGTFQPGWIQTGGDRLPLQALFNTIVPALGAVATEVLRV